MLSCSVCGEEVEDDDVVDGFPLCEECSAEIPFADLAGEPLVLDYGTDEHLHDDDAVDEMREGLAELLEDIGDTF